MSDIKFDYANRQEIGILEKLSFMHKENVDYHIGIIRDKKLKNIYIESTLIKNVSIINKVLKLSRIVTKYIIAGYNPPIFVIVNKEDQIKVVQIGYRNTFDNCIDSCIIDNTVDMLILDKLEYYPKKIILPDNIELVLNINKSNYKGNGKKINIELKNIEHIKDLRLGFDHNIYYTNIIMNKHLIFDRIQCKKLNLHFLYKCNKIEFRGNANIEILYNYVSILKQTLILNSNTKEINSSTQHLCIKTPLKVIELNGVKAKYNDETGKFEEIIGQSLTAIDSLELIT